MKSVILFGIALFVAVAHTRANDGFGGIGANGLEFAQTDKVAMLSEDLFISIDQIKVSYVFENTSDEDVTGEVIFPLPPIALQDLFYSDTNLPEDTDRENLVNFTVEVDGRGITPKVERRAVRFSYAPGTGEPTVGEDVTALLEEAGVPLTLKPDRLVAAMDKLTPAALEKLVSAGLVELQEGAPQDSAERYSFKWAIAIRYHWTQTFPAGTKVAIKHAYENHPPGGIWSWQHPATEDYQLATAERYCVDEATSKALTRCRMSYHIDYILRTANTWQGPIGTFKLTVDKGSPNNILSLCATGVKKTGPTTFVIEKTDYSPPDDLRILIATP
jgi:hypothetical protein